MKKASETLEFKEKMLDNNHILLKYNIFYKKQHNLIEIFIDDVFYISFSRNDKGFANYTITNTLLISNENGVYFFGQPTKEFLKDFYLICCSDKLKCYNLGKNNPELRLLKQVQKTLLNDKGLHKEIVGKILKEYV
jgi:hypothetical protein